MGMELNVDSVAEGDSERLVAALAAGTPLPPSWTAEVFAAPPPASGERPIIVDQTNISVVVGEQVVVKWIREPSRTPHRAPGILARLAAAGFTRTAPPYAAVHRDGILVALVTGYLPEAHDGWDWCVDAVMAAEPFAADLGALTADLHTALATSYDKADGAGWHARAVAAASEAARLTAGEDGRWLEFRAAEFEAALRPLLAMGETPVQIIHGDLHVGQVLRWPGGYAVIDFDGNPTLDDPDEPQPAARDVAQLLTSLEHVAQIAVKRRGADPAAMADWAKVVRRELLEAYVARLEELGRAEIFDRRLLRAFEVEQECRELIYAARFLERWRYAPMGVLRRWFG
jgi:maltokinase